MSSFLSANRSRAELDQEQNKYSRNFDQSAKAKTIPRRRSAVLMANLTKMTKTAIIRVARMKKASTRVKTQTRRANEQVKRKT